MHQDMLLGGLFLSAIIFAVLWFIPANLFNGFFRVGHAHVQTPRLNEK